MEGWGWALLLKPLGVLFWFALVVVIPVALVAILRPLFPEGRVKDFLFRERGRHRTSGAAGSGDSRLDHTPVSSRDAR